MVKIISECVHIFAIEPENELQVVELKETSIFKR